MLEWGRPPPHILVLWSGEVMLAVGAQMMTSSTQSSSNRESMESEHREAVDPECPFSN